MKQSAKKRHFRPKRDFWPTISHLSVQSTYSTHTRKTPSAFSVISVKWCSVTHRSGWKVATSTPKKPQYKRSVSSWSKLSSFNFPLFSRHTTSSNTCYVKSARNKSPKCFKKTIDKTPFRFPLWCGYFGFRRWLLKILVATQDISCSEQQSSTQ